MNIVSNIPLSLLSSTNLVHQFDVNTYRLYNVNVLIFANFYPTYIWYVCVHIVQKSDLHMTLGSLAAHWKIQCTYSANIYRFIAPARIVSTMWRM